MTVLMTRFPGFLGSALLPGVVAEADVRGRMAAGIPPTIYRPSIVVGDSRSGKTQNSTDSLREHPGVSSAAMF
ncbi:SDR family oxidoreductase [Mycobacterium spongiae]|uniref:Thioester reductase (TE) domain-containing protein n=1 Tax=Mycobacterium spongiae TaxID=886343 RepID=A0A975K1L6_9MYCO|nr:SDR family oxidoreductase [Mycobacterium spongiae]QUR69019.1 hypothetical protein F6B93_19840 [Mycobacterium spongiae]